MTHFKDPLTLWVNLCCRTSALGTQAAAGCETSGAPGRTFARVPECAGSRIKAPTYLCTSSFDHVPARLGVTATGDFSCRDRSRCCLLID